MTSDGVETLKVRRFPHPTIDEILDNWPGLDFKAGKKYEESAQMVAKQQQQSDKNVTTMMMM